LLEVKGEFLWKDEAEFLARFHANAARRNLPRYLLGQQLTLQIKFVMYGRRHTLTMVSNVVLCPSHERSRPGKGDRIQHINNQSAARCQMLAEVGEAGPDCCVRQIIGKSRPETDDDIELALKDERLHFAYKVCAFGVFGAGSADESAVDVDADWFESAAAQQLAQ
jgi:hypothetical protein